MQDPHSRDWVDSWVNSHLDPMADAAQVLVNGRFQTVALV